MGEDNYDARAGMTNGEGVRDSYAFLRERGLPIGGKRPEVAAGTATAAAPVKSDLPNDDYVQVRTPEGTFYITMGTVDALKEKLKGRVNGAHSVRAPSIDAFFEALEGGKIPKDDFKAMQEYGVPGVIRGYEVLDRQTLEKKLEQEELKQ
ncbi:hypothetical protein JXB11_02225 [Candidatus Woesearchaeota archaeon]|nr:hypothetical protein [Candidatus Woesearchaeota archaeon]